MKNIAILGGAFDPPTIGHMAIAEAVLKLSHIEGVWFMPCYTHMFGKDMTDYTTRVAMLQKAIKGKGSLGVFQFEREHNLTNGSTYELLNILKNDKWYANHNFSFILGLDNADNIRKWYRWEEVIKLVPFIVLPRDGEVPKKNAWYSKKPHRILNKRIPNVSSTLARKYLQNGELENARGILDENVYSYIIEKGLYRSK